MIHDAIVTHQLTKRFDGRVIVNSLDLRIPSGTVYGLLGRNGAGKSTTIRILAGMIRPDEGTATLLGESVGNLRPETTARIAYIAEGHPLISWMTIGEATRFARSFHRHWNPEILDQILDYFKLSESKKLRQLSKGQQAQVSLALAVAPAPDVLLLDDPTAGLDPVFRIDFLESLVQFLQNQKGTVLFTSHILRDVDRIADRIGIMMDGVLRVDCSLDTFRTSVKKILLRFGRQVPECPSFRGMVSCRRVGNSLELITVGFDDDQRAHLESLAPHAIDVLQLSVEDAFIEYTRGHKRPLPSF
jgi:ABC-2 type transport system ATP-binding protein